jgi:alkanesulfonate monooxygenase SsuD/methylene tetrahydromethanopterin reductase-like flavin-dependent oxidoreductase (luciferase family)
VAETVERARVEGGDASRGVLDSYARRGQLHARLDPSEPDSPLDPMPLDAGRPEFLDRAADHCFLGSPESVMAQMHEYAAAGVTQLQLRVLIQDLPPDVVARTVRLLGREVLPSLR